MSECQTQCNAAQRAKRWRCDGFAREKKAFPATITIETRDRNAGLSGNGEAASASRERIAHGSPAAAKDTCNRRYSATCTGSGSGTGTGSGSGTGGCSAQKWPASCAQESGMTEMGKLDAVAGGVG